MRTTLARCLAPTALALVLPVALVGCGGGDDDADPAPDPTSATSTDQAAPNPISPPDLPEPPEVADKAGAVADITYDDCGTGAGRQSISGTVTNPTKKPISYVIVFNWINDTSDVLGRGFTVVEDLDPGDSADWDLRAKVADGATQCVPNVVRGRVEAG